MFNYIPEAFAAETAKDEAEADAWLRGEEGAMRPPELLTRDVVARAIMDEVEAGRGSPQGGAFLDIANRRDADHIRRKLPSMYHQFKELAGLDITKEPMQVGPTTHYMMGGVRVDPATGASSVTGLYTAGEAAAGMHGANRLGGNSLSDLLVFGNLAGQAAATYAASSDRLPPVGEEVEAARNAALAPFEEGSENPYHLHQELQEIMEAHVGIVREGAVLEAGIAKLEALQARLAQLHASGGRDYNPSWHLCLDLHNMILTSLAVTRAGLERTESRGAHTRIDYPNYDDELGLVNLVIRRSVGDMVVVRAPLSDMPAELAKFVAQEAV